MLDLHRQQLVGHGEIADLGLEAADLDVTAIGWPGLERRLAGGQERVAPRAKLGRRHRHREFLAFLRHVDRNVPAEFDVHLIIDNYATHKHAKVKAWLAQRSRYHVHYTPTYASRLNQIERWFGLITQQAIRRGSFASVKELVAKIDHFVAHSLPRSTVR